MYKIFFFRRKTPEEGRLSLGGSGMCIGDRSCPAGQLRGHRARRQRRAVGPGAWGGRALSRPAGPHRATVTPHLQGAHTLLQDGRWLLYTPDAADE